MAEKKDIGGIWEKTSKQGTRFWSGSIEIGGDKVKFTAFRNKYKKPGGNQPDYTILPAYEFKDGKTDTNSRSQEDNDGINGEEEIPF